MRIICKYFLPFTVLLLLSFKSFSFDENYEARVGDYNFDGLTDVFVTHTPKIVLIHGEVIIPVTVSSPSRVNEFLLQQNSDKSFSIVSGFSPSELATMKKWNSSNARLIFGDYNLDGNIDLMLRNIAGEIPGANDQMIFASNVADMPPAHIREISSDVKQFYSDLNRYLHNRDYFEIEAFRNDWIETTQGPATTQYWDFAYLHFWKWNWYNGAVQITNSEYDDFNNPDAQLEICNHFLCDFDPTYGVWFVWTTAREIEVEFDYSNFNQLALSLREDFDDVVENGELNCGGGSASVIVDVMRDILGTDIFGNIFSTCGVLDSELEYDPLTIPAARFGRLVLAINDTDVDIKSSQGDPDENKMDLEATLEYLKNSEKFRVLYEKALKAGVKIRVDRNPVDRDPYYEGSNFDHETNTVIWDPDDGNVIKNGVSSPAIILAHEISHAVRMLEIGKEQYEYEKRIYYEIDPYRPPPQNKVVKRGPEEDRAAIEEAEIAAELGEPQRQGYGDSGPVLVDDPTHSCHISEPGCHN